MTSEDVDKIVRAIDRASLTVSASILMSGWVPDHADVARNERASTAILTARALLHDAVSSAFVLVSKNGGAV